VSIFPCYTGEVMMKMMTMMTMMSYLSHLFTWLLMMPLIGCLPMDTCYYDASEFSLNEVYGGWLRMPHVNALTDILCVVILRSQCFPARQPCSPNQVLLLAASVCLCVCLSAQKLWKLRFRFIALVARRQKKFKKN